jgi:hypothetical protein
VTPFDKLRAGSTGLRFGFVLEAADASVEIPTEAMGFDTTIITKQVCCAAVWARQKRRRDQMLKRGVGWDGISDELGGVRGMVDYADC